MRIRLIFLLLLISVFFKSPDLYAQVEQMTLKQKLEKGIVENQSFQDQRFLVSVQGPVANKLKMVDFKWQLIDWPFIIKYPGSWYVRESYLDTSTLFITQEPVNQIADQFKVGMTLHYYPNYFAVEKPLVLADQGKAAAQPVYLNNWDDFKKEYSDQVKQLAQSVISIKDISLSGKPAVRMEFKTNQNQVLCFYIKNNNDLIQMLYQAPSAEFSQYGTVFDLMVESFYFK